MAALAMISGNILVHFAFLIVLIFNLDGIVKEEDKKAKKNENCTHSDMQLSIRLFVIAHIFGLFGPFIEYAFTRFRIEEYRLLGVMIDFLPIPMFYIA